MAKKAKAEEVVEVAPQEVVTKRRSNIRTHYVYRWNIKCSKRKNSFTKVIIYISPNERS